MKTILLINGPNLNMLGKRETSIYGKKTLNEIVDDLQEWLTTQPYPIQLKHQQSNAEHEIIEVIQQSLGKVDFIIINPAAYTHTSIAIRDALLAVEIPFLEVHLSNIYSREQYRQHSYLSDIAVGVITGLGVSGYQFALDYGLHYLRHKTV